jgi:hypothetical protein
MLQGFHQLCKLGLKLKHKPTRPPAASETRWAGILPQFAWVNKHHDVLVLYERKPAKGYVSLDDDTTFDNYKLTDYDWLSIDDLDAALRPVGSFIITMEATERVTCSLVLPMVYAILHATSPDVPVQRYVYVNGELTDEQIKASEELACEVQDVRRKLHNENKDRFITGERIGHREDLLVSTILDPRFKLVNFHGCTNEMQEDAESYLRSAYKIDWSPDALAKTTNKKKLPKVKKRTMTRMYHRSPLKYPLKVSLRYSKFR